MEVFFVSRNGHQEGPHSVELIEDKLASGYLAPHDYIYDPSQNDWVLLSEFAKTKSACQRIGQKDEVTNSIELETPDNTWYLLRDNAQSGPYDTREIVKMLQEQKAFEFDYVWAPVLKSWERISDCSYFSEEKIRPYLDGGKQSKASHFRRRSVRVELRTSLILHNNKKVWNGSGFEVSAGGASLEVPDTCFKSGDIITIHYRPSKNVPAFNVHCEVVSAKPSPADPSSKTMRLGLRFIRVNSTSQEVLKQIISHRAA